MLGDVFASILLILFGSLLFPSGIIVFLEGLNSHLTYNRGSNVFPPNKESMIAGSILFLLGLVFIGIVVQYWWI